ncbi:phage tail protein, partial [Lacticaseibacillus hegangensis]
MVVKALETITLARVDDGKVGVPGKAGADGKTPYFHIAYATSANGSSGFSTTDSVSKTYIGQYTDFVQADSTDPTRYAWTLIKGEKGDTGPSGKDITSYDSGMVLPDTVAPKNSQFWVVDKDGIVTAFYKSDGTKWVSQEISASTINAATFNGLEFNGVNFNGSNFVSRFTSKPLEDSRLTADDGHTEYIDKGTGTAKLANGYLTIEGTVDGSSTQTFHVEIGPSGISSEIRDTNTLVAGSLSKGVLTLAYKDGATLYQGTIDAQIASQIDNVGTLAWSGALYPSASDRAICSIPLNQTRTGWLIRWSYYAKGNQNNYYNYTLLPNIVNQGKINNLYVTISMPGLGTFFKRLWWDNTGITGSADNVAGSQAP